MRSSFLPFAARALVLLSVLSSRPSVSSALVSSSGSSSRLLSVLAPSGDRVFVDPFANLICNVDDFGAKGDGVTTNTAAIQKAMDSCASAGGGTVLFPSNGGRYISGPLFLRSNLIVFVDAGSALLGTTDKSNATWIPVYTRVAGTMQFGPASLLNGGVCVKIDYNSSAIGDQCQEWTKLQNVTLAGSGTIDGQGEGWWVNPYLNYRPTLLGLLWIQGLTIRDLTITQPPFWTTHPTFCDQVLVENVNITTTGPNTDGVDPDSCTNVVIRDSYISTGDDCIAIKSGKDADGRAVGRPSANITVENMVFGQGHGIAIGSEMSGNVVNVLFRNLTVVGTQRGPRVKAAVTRGGVVANVTFEDITIVGSQEAISITMLYSSPSSEPSLDDDDPPPPTFANITVRNLFATHTQTAGEFQCLPNSPCHGLVVSNVTIVNPQNGYTCQNAFGTVTASSPTPCLQPEV